MPPLRSVGSSDSVTDSDLFGPGLPLTWLPDETLFSFASRYHRLSGHLRSETTCQTLFGHRRMGSAHDLPSLIAIFVHRTRSVLGSAEEIIFQRTLLPYYLPFKPKLIADNAVASMKEAGIGGLKFRLGIPASGFRAHHPLKFCPDCRDADGAANHLPYWRWIHQLPSAWLCPTHATELSATEIKAEGNNRFEWFLPDECDTHRATSEDVSLEYLRRLGDVAISLSRNAARIRYDTDRVALTILGELAKQGFLGGPSGTKLERESIGNAYTHFLRGVRKIPALNPLPATENQAADEIDRILHRPSHVHVTRIISAITWLFGSMDRFESAYWQPLSQYKPKSCNLPEQEGPNTELDANDSRRANLIAILTEGRTVTAAAKAVGIDIATAKAWASAQGISTGSRASKMRGMKRQAMIDALRRGEPKEDIARQANLSVQSVTRLMRSEIGLGNAWHQARHAQKQAEARKQWREAIESDPSSGPKAARLLKPAAYAWLYRNDRAWLRTSIETIEQAPRHGGRTVDWDARDIELAKQIERAALAAYLESPDRKITIARIKTLVPSLPPKLKHLNRLPLTQRAIEAAIRRRPRRPKTHGTQAI